MWLRVRPVAPADERLRLIEQLLRAHDLVHVRREALRGALEIDDVLLALVRLSEFVSYASVIRENIASSFKRIGPMFHLRVRVRVPALREIEVHAFDLLDVGLALGVLKIWKKSFE